MRIPVSRGPVPRRRATRIVTAVVVVLALVGSGIGWYVSDRSDRTSFTAMFRESVGIYPGSTVRILGVTVGGVDSVEPHGTEVAVHMHVDDGISVRADTRAVVIEPSLVSDRYVQLTGVYTSGPKLTSGTVIPISRTATSVEIDQLTRGIVSLTTALGPRGANRNGALADLLDVGAANLAGNGVATKQTLARLARLAGTLSGNRSALFRTIDNLATFTGTLARNDRSVRGLNRSLAAVSRVLAQDRQSFTTALSDLTFALGRVQAFIDSHRVLLSSNVHKLAGITQALTTERASLAAALSAAPVAVDNLINAYDRKHRTLDGRADLNEISGIDGDPAAPPAMLPSTGSTLVTGGGS